MAKEVNYISIKEFREQGFLQELNRLFLHPMGMALEVKVDDAGNEILGGIWDYRNDEEGILYSDNVLALEKFKENVRNVRELRIKMADQRIDKFGYVIQPSEVDGQI